MRDGCMTESEEEQKPNQLVSLLLQNRSWLNGVSIGMIIFATWAVIEILTNTFGGSGSWPPITGTETNIDAADTQRNNSGLVISSGAILGLIGLTIQYIYRVAPYVDSTMVATATRILEQAAGHRVGEEDIISKAEEAATTAGSVIAVEVAAAVAESIVQDTLSEATTLAKETAEDTVIGMMSSDIEGEDNEVTETDEESVEELPQETEDSEEGPVPEEKKKF